MPWFQKKLPLRKVEKQQKRAYVTAPKKQWKQKKLPLEKRSNWEPLSSDESVQYVGFDRRNVVKNPFETQPLPKKRAVYVSYKEATHAVVNPYKIAKTEAKKREEQRNLSKKRVIVPFCGKYYNMSSRHAPYDSEKDGYIKTTKRTLTTTVNGKVILRVDRNPQRRRNDPWESSDDEDDKPQYPLKFKSTGVRLPIQRNIVMSRDGTTYSIIS